MDCKVDRRLEGWEPSGIEGQWDGRQDRDGREVGWIARRLARRMEWCC
jgi:hypothetical protein